MNFFDCVLTAVNNNPQYYQFVPNFITCWRHLFPEIEIKIIFINNELIPELEPYAEYITLFKPLENINPVYTAQNIRLYYPAILNKKGVLITDIDLCPMNRTYYESPLKNNILDDTFVSYRPKGCVGHDQIAIPYNIASSKMWSKLTGVNSIENVKEKLIQFYPENYGEKCEPPLDWLRKGWYRDQEVLFKLVETSNIKINYVGDKNFNRLDRLNQTLEKMTKVICNIKSGIYSDFNNIRNETENYKELNKLVIDNLLKNSVVASSP
jgi:hypothetical protein